MIELPSVKRDSPGPWVTRGIATIGSLKLTFVILLALFGGVVFAYVSEKRPVWALVVPLLACAINLLAAMFTNGIFRRQLPLLVFHLALLTVLLLVAVGQLTRMKGRVEVLQGGEFSAEGTMVEAGPWHVNRLDQIRFFNDGFTIEYGPRWKRGATRNSIRAPDSAGNLQRLVIGDMDAFTSHGYKFYTSPNKGFAPVFSWKGKSAPAPIVGAVHFPSYPIHDYGQAQSWQLPDTHITAWVMLETKQPVIDPEKADNFKIPEDHTLVLRIGDQRWELRPGESVEILEGRLTYQDLRTWMGYTIFYDWTIPWLLAACVLAITAMGLHFWTKYAAKPWNEP